MPGVLGAGGPPPKRESQRRRSNKSDVPVEHAPAGDVVVPWPSSRWHPVAKRWFESLAVSGQSAFYEASDWATAYVLAESMSRELKPQPFVVGRGENATVEKHELPPKGASLQAWLKGMTSLMVTEGDRRRLRLELVRSGGEEAVPDDVSELAEYRARFKSG